MRSKRYSKGEKVIDTNSTGMGDMNFLLCVVEVKLSNVVDLGSRNAGDECRIKSPNSGCMLT